jgi:hypothetical protein
MQCRIGREEASPTHGLPTDRVKLRWHLDRATWASRTRDQSDEQPDEQPDEQTVRLRTANLHIPAAILTTSRNLPGFRSSWRSV